MAFFLVALAKQRVPLLTYQASDDLELKLGDIITVPFRSNEAIGIIWEELGNTAKDIKPEKIKFIINKINLPQILPQNFKAFLNIIIKYYMLDYGSVCKMVLPVDLSAREKIEKDNKNIAIANLPYLNPEQSEVHKILDENQGVVLLKGVTGSGKTEVYFHQIFEAINNIKQVLLMLPEIGLTTQIVERFTKTFGFKPAIWHSEISMSQKRKILRGVIRGDIKVVIGTRSSLFLPYQDLGLIVIDEEHDNSYKQEENILYNARDAAVLRAYYQKIPIILVSATPSIESYYNAITGKYTLVELHSRFGEAKMPNMNLIDMRLEVKDRWLSEPLKKAIKEALVNKQQSLLFLNRRGYAPLMLCRVCGYRFACSNCSAWLVVHKKVASLSCHHCGHHEKIPMNCPTCLHDSLVACGPGVERVAEEVAKEFPEAKLQIITKEQLSSQEAFAKILQEIEDGQVDIIIGTQIITKGYHFPKLTVVGIIDADLGLSNIDLKASERSFQLLQQVSGRAGREEFEGHVFIQTYLPDNPIIQVLAANKVDAFYNAELLNRKNENLPPYSRIAALLITGNNDPEVLGWARNILSLAPITKLVTLLGPAPATLSKLRGDYRYRILIIADKKFNIQQYIQQWVEELKLPSKISLRIEIDPYSFY